MNRTRPEGLSFRPRPVGEGRTPPQSDTNPSSFAGADLAAAADGRARVPRAEFRDPAPTRIRGRNPIVAFSCDPTGPGRGVGREFAEAILRGFVRAAAVAMWWERLTPAEGGRMVPSPGPEAAPKMAGVAVREGPGRAPLAGIEGQA